MKFNHPYTTTQAQGAVDFFSASSLPSRVLLAALANHLCWNPLKASQITPFGQTASDLTRPKTTVILLPGKIHTSPYG